MNKVANLISDGTITVEDLANSKNLIEQAEFVKEALEACKKTLAFPLGLSQLDCYSYIDTAGEYESWGIVTNDGIFTCFCNWGGNHMTGQCDLKAYSNVFLHLDTDEFGCDLKRFLSQQIEKAKLFA